MDLFQALKQEGVSPELIDGVLAYRDGHGISSDSRVPEPHFMYYGRDVWEEALAAILSGANVLLVGAKATGKNVLSENLAALFGRPLWNVSFHIDMDAAYLVGTDTFRDGAVAFRPGPVYECARLGGFGVLDEINMARNEALAVLHSLLDYRRVLDIPGYEVMRVHPAARFIATMNYGYAGTRDLNEALLSRFAVIRLPSISHDNLLRLLHAEFPSIKDKAAKQFAMLFLELEKKCEAGEVSAGAVDLRGLIDALHLMELGLEPHRALDMGITNKSFDEFEPQLVRDAIAQRLPSKLTRDDIFG